MTLTELKQAVDSAIERAVECDRDPNEIFVTLQLDDVSGSSIWSDRDVELHWDNDCQACGCVLVGITEGEDDDE